MSEAHIPQPATGMAPAEIFSSTDAAPHGATVSAIGTPGGPTSESGQHAGQFNGIDPVIMEQFIQTSTFSWNVSQTPGTLIWKVPIHPNFSTPQLAHLMRMYNVWAGGISFNVKIAGTGFHAGAIAFVRIPPNRKPEEFTTPQSWTNFEYQVIDPKTLEIASFDVMDQRRIMYHYAKFDQEDVNSFGGWFCCYVLMTLNTSATGSTEIDVAVFQKPAPTFQFAQLMNPTIQPVSNPIPSELEKALDFKVNNSSAYFRAPCDRLVILPGSTKILDRGIAGHVAFDTKQPSKMTYLYELQTDLFIASVALSGDIHTLSLLEAERVIGFPPVGPISGQTLSNDGTFVIFNDTHSMLAEVSKTYGSTTSAWDWNTLTYKFTDTTHLPIGTVQVIFNPMDVPTGDTALTLPVSSESFVTLGMSANKFRGSQNYAFAQLLATGQYSSLLPSNTALVFSCIDTEFDIPIFLVKIYKSGLMSTNAVEAEVSLDLLKHKFVYYGYILETDPLPKDPIMAANLANSVMRSNQRRIMKHAGIL